MRPSAPSVTTILTAARLLPPNYSRQRELGRAGQGSLPPPPSINGSRARSRSSSPARQATRQRRCRPTSATALRHLLLFARRRCWECDCSTMDVTQLDVFRYCRWLRHAGKVCFMKCLVVTAVCRRRLSDSSCASPPLPTDHGGVCAGAHHGHLLHNVENVRE